MPSAEVNRAMSAPRVLIRPSVWKIRNVGITVSWNGIRAVASRSTSVRFLPRELIRANAYPARLHMINCDTTTVPETMTLFRNHRGKSELARTRL
jgi:hypothetical protein